MVTFSFQKAISEALNHLAQTHGMRPIELITEDSVMAFAKELFATVSPDQFKAKDLEMLDSLKTRLHQAESAHVSRGEAGPSENGLVGQIDQMITLLRARSLPVKDKPSDGQAQTASSTSGEKRTLFENLPGELQAKVASGVSLNTRRALALTSHMGHTASVEASEQVLAELVTKLGSIDDSFVDEMKTLQGSGDLEK